MEDLVFAQEQREVAAAVAIGERVKAWITQDAHDADDSDHWLTDPTRDEWKELAALAVATTLNIPSIRDAFAPVRPITPRELARAMFFGRLSDPNGDQAERAWMAAGGDAGALDYDAAMVLQQLRSGREG